MVAQTAELKNRLPDGRPIRAFVDAKGKNTFTQVEMFALAKCIPKGESIMTNNDHDASIRFGLSGSVNVNDCWRTREYVAYEKGFGIELGKPIGKEIRYVQDGILYVLVVPDVPVFDPISRKRVNLQKITQMAVFRDIGLLTITQKDEKRFEVSVASDLKQGDVKSVGTIRNGWGLVDVDGFPLRTRASNERVLHARCLHVPYDFDFSFDETGYHGSVVRGRHEDSIDSRRTVTVDCDWYLASGVALVGATVPSDVKLGRDPKV